MPHDAVKLTAAVHAVAWIRDATSTAAYGERSARRKVTREVNG